ncbi:MAG: hypothetical protein MPJ22_00510 [Pirellulales bacterium]|nr:hypothetical protein [Pirellulales bacterium]
MRRTRRADFSPRRRRARASAQRSHDARPPPVLIFDDGDHQMRGAGNEDGAAPRASLMAPRFRLLRDRRSALFGISGREFQTLTAVAQANRTN